MLRISVHATAALASISTTATTTAGVRDAGEKSEAVGDEVVIQLHIPGATECAD
jgi:hypothetical protein